MFIYKVSKSSHPQTMYRWPQLVVSTYCSTYLIYMYLNTGRKTLSICDVIFKNDIGFASSTFKEH